MKKLKCVDCGQLFLGNLIECPNCGCPSASCQTIEEDSSYTEGNILNYNSSEEQLRAEQQQRPQHPYQPEQSEYQQEEPVPDYYQYSKRKLVHSKLFVMS